jgi:hypothetical protein
MEPTQGPDGGEGLQGGSGGDPGGDSGRPRTRTGRVLGILAAVGFSLAMWAFIALAVLGLVLKAIG